MRNTVLVAYSAIRKIKALSWNIAIRVRRIVCGQPVRGKLSGGQNEAPGTMIKHGPCLNENLFGPVRCAGGGGGTDIGSQFLKPVVRSQGHPTESTCSVDCILARGHGRTSSEHRLIIRGGVSQVHRDVFSLAGRRVDAVCIAGVWGCGHSGGADMARTKGAFQGRVGDIMVGRL